MSVSRFVSTAQFYVKFRSRYPAALLKRLAERCRLDGRGRLLDLGCGPGFIAIAMAPHFAEVVGMDPEPEMIEMAAHEAAAADVRLTLVHGGSDDLGRHLGNFRMVTMGRSFHWMDRDGTLAALDALIESGGCVVILTEHHTDAPENRFKAQWDRVINRWAGEAGRARAHRHGPDWMRNESVLRLSSFNRVERLTVTYSRQTGIDGLIGRSYSMSVSSLAILGENRDAFEQELRTELLRFAPAGVFTEVVEAEALIGFRPA
jgi:SAM-dependent methyltransferase